jgi:hypothetical protein
MNETVAATSTTPRAESDTVAYRIEERIAWVKFNRPEKRNCMSPALNRRMLEVLDLLEFHPDVGVVVLTGEGTSWSAGMDLKEYFREVEVQGLGAVRRAQRESYGWWRRLRSCVCGGGGEVWSVGDQLGHSAGRWRHQSGGRTHEHARCDVSRDDRRAH